MTNSELHSKVDQARDNLEKLRHIPQESLDQFLSDFRNLDSALRRLQTTIQATIDIGSWIISARGLPAPGTSRAVLEILAEGGILPADAETRWGPIIGFRNRIVHLYDDIDPVIVYEVLTEGRADLLELFELLAEAAVE